MYKVKRLTSVVLISQIMLFNIVCSLVLNGAPVFLAVSFSLPTSQQRWEVQMEPKILVYRRIQLKLGHLLLLVVPKRERKREKEREENVNKCLCKPGIFYNRIITHNPSVYKTMYKLRQHEIPWTGYEIRSLIRKKLDIIKSILL